MAAIVAVFLNYVAAHLSFFGQPVLIDPEDMRNYWVCVSGLVLSVLASFAVAWWRGATKSFVWHSIMALIGLIVSVLFAVTQTGAPVSPQPEPPQPPPSGSVCHSGGDSSECVGG